MKGSKWTWLYDKCIELGYIESAKLAQEIEDVLHRIYGVTNTEAWMNVAEDVIEEDFKRAPCKLITETAFCCACVEASRVGIHCSECAFGRETGICDNSDALYLNFYKMFRMEQSKT